MANIWQFANTSVRSAMRLRSALVALAALPQQPSIRKHEGDKFFRKLLGEAGVVSLGSDETVSLGRKWRHALGRMGYLYPLIPNNSSVTQAQIGDADHITPAGFRLIRSETIPAIQECNLRGLVALYDEIEDESGQKVLFSPLKHTLEILLEVEKETGEAGISFHEFALFVQTLDIIDDTKKIVENILSFRSEREAAQSKRQFKREKYALRSAELNGENPNNFSDYGDENIRYLKSTGMVQNRGRGIAIVPEKHHLVELLVEDRRIPTNELERILTHCNGADLPTDSQDTATLLLSEQLDQVEQMGLKYSIDGRAVDTPADIAIIRHEIDDIVSKAKEELFAERQVLEWQEIYTYLDMIVKGQTYRLIDEDYELKIPKSDRPAYLEWILWRAFLAIDSLSNKPYEARRFNVDQDFLPIGTAPGGGPDLIIEFADFVIVVEVTLTESSRQEAAEGEPVRRHVADELIRYNALNGKTVIGLFIAQNIDSNTAETFRIGAWYNKDDERMRLDITPLTIAQFKDFFKVLFENDSVSPSSLRSLMEECDSYRSDNYAPEWKNLIEQTVRRAIVSLS